MFLFIQPIFILLASLFLCLVQQPVFAQAVSTPLMADARGKVVSYNPNEVYLINTHYLVSTDIILGEDEIINAEDLHFGDVKPWDVQVSRNHLYIKATRLIAGGNLNFTTNKYSYHFILTVSDAPMDSSDQVLFLRFMYPNHGKAERHLALQLATVPTDICQDKSKYNMQYSFTGNDEQAPVRACDDGIFTYFKFRKQVEMPAIFMVLPNRKEAVVNYRMEKGYVVVERIARAFTLRNGDIVTSVYNDKYIGDWDKVK